MERPEKRKIKYPADEQNKFKFYEDYGHNQCCLELERWLPGRVELINLIRKAIYRSKHDENTLNSMDFLIAEAIDKRLGGDK